jgi:hypothetical protein
MTENEFAYPIGFICATIFFGILILMLISCLVYRLRQQNRELLNTSLNITEQEQQQHQHYRSRQFPSNDQIYVNATIYSIETDLPPSYYDAVNLQNESIDTFAKQGSCRTGQRPERLIDEGGQQHVGRVPYRSLQQRQHQQQQQHRQHQQQHRQESSLQQQPAQLHPRQQRLQQQQLSQSVQISRCVSANASVPRYAIETDPPPSYDETIIERLI